MKGIDFVVLWNGDGNTLEVVAGGRADKIQTDCATIPVSSATDSEWEHVIAGRKSWSIQVGWLMMNGRAVEDVLKVGETYTLRFYNQNGLSGGVQGTAMLKTCVVSADVSTLANGSFAFQGNGPLTAVPHVQG